MGITFKNSLPKITGDVKLEVATPTYSGKKSTDANDSINPYTSAGPGVAGAGLTEIEINSVRDPSIDPFSAQTTLLMNFNGTNGSTTFTDEVGHAVSIATGSPTITDTLFKYGGTSLDIPSGGRLSVTPDSSEFAFGTGDFTVETWVRSEKGNIANWFTTRSTSSSEPGSWSLGSWTDGIDFLWSVYSGGFKSIIVPNLIVVNDSEFMHFAVTRESGTLRIFQNGIIKSTTASYNWDILSLQPLSIGGGPDGFLTDGKFDDIRITKGVARYTANFTPPQELSL